MSQQRLLGEFAPATYEQWRALLKVDDFDRKLVTRTLDGIHVQPLYTPANIPPNGFASVPATPGGSWEIRQNAAPPSADADPIGTLARHGVIANNVEQAKQALVSLAKSRKATDARTVIVSSSIYHDAGASPALETGIALSTYVTYLRWLIDAGVNVNDATASIELSVSVGTDFFGEIAKLRALRLCVAKVIAHCGGEITDATIAIHARMSRRSLTQRDPWVNMLRATTETFAAAAGGANAITTAPYDLLQGNVSELGKRIAENAQIVLDEESHVRAVSDPAAGSYYVETLTLELARAAWKHFTEIESAGGALIALQDGVIHKAIKAHADKTLSEVKNRKRPITGVSEFALINEPTPATASAAPASKPATGGITVEALQPARLSEPFEALRDRSDAYLKQHGKRPQLFLCNVGTMAQWKPRAGYTQNFAWAGGIDAVGAEQGYANADEAVAAFVASGATLAAICSHDDLYPELIPVLAKALRDKGARLVVSAGKPGEQEARYREAGVGLFIHMGCDVVAALDSMLANAESRTTAPTKVGC